MNLLRWIKMTVVLLALGAIGFGAAFYVTLERAKKRDVSASTVTLEPASAPLGGAVTGTLEVRSPWGRTVRAAALEPGAGAVTVGQPRVITGREYWGEHFYRIVFVLKGVREGQAAPGKLQVELSNGKTLDFSVPGFQVGAVEVAPGSAPEIAEALALDARALQSLEWLWLFALAGGLLVLFLYFLLRDRWRKGARELTFTEKSLIELAAIREELAAGKHPVARLYVFLTDAVRRYLENRFSIPASTRTTDEFLNGLDAMPIPREYRPFLSGFLEDAELVKFARREASDASLLQAVDSAEKLVRGTAEPENDKTKNSNEGAAK